MILDLILMIEESLIFMYRCLLHYIKEWTYILLVRYRKKIKFIIFNFHILFLSTTKNKYLILLQNFLIVMS